MTEQDPLFTDGPDRLPEPPQLTAGERARAKAQLLIDQGLHPLNRLPLLQPAGHRCGDCAHKDYQGGTAGRYMKCELGPVTRGPGTDIRAGWPACNQWQERP